MAEEKKEEKIWRISLTLPEGLLEEVDRISEAQEYPSRSEAIRDALRDFLADYKWRRELKGEQLGAIICIYDHEVRGLPDELQDIQHQDREIVSSVQHFHISERDCLETLIVEGEGERIRELVDRLGSLRGVKQVKLATVGR